MVAKRYNAMGQSFIVSSIDGGVATEIIHKGDRLVVREPYEHIMQAWFNWQMRGEFIQQAFHFLNAEEREFILTGITPREWKAIFIDTTVNNGEGE